MTRSSKRAEYKFKADEFIKIWFSKNQDIFLPMVNQVRFINFILDHPGSDFNFIYKASSLSDNAREELLSFCETFGVIPIDFDGIETTSKIDKQLKQLVNTEIENAVNNKGGDLGSASDMARLIPNVIKLGFYLDFDTKAKFNKTLYIAEVPLLGDIRIIGNSGSTNNQFIAVAKQSNGEIHRNAATALEKMSKNILNKYSSFKEIKTKSIDKITWDTLSDIFSMDFSYTEQSLKNHEATTTNIMVKYMLIQYFESEYSKNPSIDSLRNFITESIKNINIIDDIKQFIYNEGVSFGFAPKEMKNMLKMYDPPIDVIYKIFVERVTGPKILEDYVMPQGQRKFFLDQDLSKAISSQFNQVEIKPGEFIDRDGDISWFHKQEPSKPFLRESGAKIFEFEELSALKGRLDKMTDTDLLFNLLQGYLSSGCEAIGGGFSEICQESDIVNITGSDSTILIEA